MSDEDEEQFLWRDTYFLYFTSAKRPTLKVVEQKLRGLREHYEIGSPTADADGKFESIRVVSKNDNAALEISYLEGEDIAEQALGLAEELKLGGDCEPKRLSQLAVCNARFDVMQFELIADPNETDEELDDEFDPSTLLVVMETLTKLVDGVGVDPQSGLMV